MQGKLVVTIALAVFLIALALGAQMQRATTRRIVDSVVTYIQPA
jgi:hypothetical protein